MAVLGRPSSSAELLAVGAIGLIATVGVLLYELRNTQLYDYGLHRAQLLEHELGFGSIRGSGGPGGLFSDRPGRTLRLFGVLPVDRDAGLSLVYSAAIAGWTYLCAWGALHALGLGHARAIGGTDRSRRGTAPARRADPRPRPTESACPAASASRAPGSSASRNA